MEGRHEATDSDEISDGLEPGGLRDSMIIPISNEGLLEHEGVESPRLDSKDGFAGEQSRGDQNFTTNAELHHNSVPNVPKEFAELAGEEPSFKVGNAIVESPPLTPPPLQLSDGASESPVNKLDTSVSPRISPGSSSPDTDGSNGNISGLLQKFDKHVFVFSEAGKPIYSRHGNEEELAALMGIMQALSSCVAHGLYNSSPGVGVDASDTGDLADQIRFIRAGHHRFVYLLRLPLVLVGVCGRKCDKSPSLPPLSFQQLQNQLLYMYNQILCVFTQSVLQRAFEQRSGFDLRRLIGGAERRLLDTLWDHMDDDLSYTLGAVRCLPMASSTRDQLTQALVQACSSSKTLRDMIIFAILITDDQQLVAMTRTKRYQLHPMDLHLIFNLVKSSTQNLRDADSTWLPICLPKFDATAFVHAYVSYVDDKNPSDEHIGIPVTRRKITPSAIARLVTTDGTRDQPAVARDESYTKLRGQPLFQPMPATQPVAGQLSSSAPTSTNTYSESSSVGGLDPPLSRSFNAASCSEERDATTAHELSKGLSSTLHESARSQNAVEYREGSLKEIVKVPDSGSPPADAGLIASANETISCGSVAILDDEKSPTFQSGHRGSQGSGQSLRTHNCPRSGLCLLLITPRRDQFDELHECRARIVERMKRADLLPKIGNAIANASSYSARDAGIIGLRHFVYKAKSSAQLSSPRFDGAYGSPPLPTDAHPSVLAGSVPKADVDEYTCLVAEGQHRRQRLIRLYHMLHARMFNPARPLKILYWANDNEALLGWHMVGFELYAVFEPLLGKEAVLRAMNKLLNWIKKEEDRLFIVQSATF